MIRDISARQLPYSRPFHATPLRLHYKKGAKRRRLIVPNDYAKTKNWPTIWIGTGNRRDSPTPVKDTTSWPQRNFDEQWLLPFFQLFARRISTPKIMSLQQSTLPSGWLFQFARPCSYTEFLSSPYAEFCSYDEVCDNHVCWRTRRTLVTIVLKEMVAPKSRPMFFQLLNGQIAQMS